MKVQYITIWKLHGANKLSTDRDPLELVRLEEPAIVASVTGTPEAFFQHIDQAAAITSQILKGLFAPDKDGTPKERLAKELETVKASRAKQIENGVFLVLEGALDIQEPDFRSRRDLEDFAICFDAIELPGIRESFRPIVQAVLTAIGLSLPANVDRRVEKLGELIYLVGPDKDKPIYTFSLRGGAARVSLASQLTKDIVMDAAKRVSKVISDKTLENPARLLTTSLNQSTDALQAFLAAWLALEMFVNASFKSTYASQWFDIMENGAPAAAKPVFKRFKDVMSDKYRLADKFLIIASVLDADSATTDAEQFLRLKEVRDDLLHALKTPSPLPTETAQNLLLKYMTMHIDRLA